MVFVLIDKFLNFEISFKLKENFFLTAERGVLSRRQLEITVKLDCDKLLSVVWVTSRKQFGHPK